MTTDVLDTELEGNSVGFTGFTLEVERLYELLCIGLNIVFRYTLSY